MIRPVDMTLTIQHAQDANRAGVSQGRPEVASQMFADRLERQVKAEETSVTQARQSEKGDINPEGRGDGRGYTPRKHRKKIPVVGTPVEGSESLFDVKV